MPERIQMSRQRPWRAEHPDAVIVDRTTKWGNPFRVARDECPAGGKCWQVHSPIGMVAHHHGSEEAAIDAAVGFFVNWLTNTVDAEGRYVHGTTDYHGAQSSARPSLATMLEELGGHDLACWCAQEATCHANVYLRIIGFAQAAQNAHDRVMAMIARTREAMTVSMAKARSLAGLPENPLCPECAQGKTGNCIGWTLDADDNEVACATAHPNGGQ